MLRTAHCDDGLSGPVRGASDRALGGDGRAAVRSGRRRAARRAASAGDLAHPAVVARAAMRRQALASGGGRRRSAFLRQGADDGRGADRAGSRGGGRPVRRLESHGGIPQGRCRCPGLAVAHGPAHASRAGRRAREVHAAVSPPALGAGPANGTSPIVQRRPRGGVRQTPGVDGERRGPLRWTLAAL